MDIDKLRTSRLSHRINLCNLKVFLNRFKRIRKFHIWLLFYVLFVNLIERIFLTQTFLKWVKGCRMLHRIIKVTGFFVTLSKWIFAFKRICLRFFVTFFKWILRFKSTFFKWVWWSQSTLIMSTNWFIEAIFKRILFLSTYLLFHCAFLKRILRLAHTLIKWILWGSYTLIKGIFRFIRDWFIIKGIWNFTLLLTDFRNLFFPKRVFGIKSIWSFFCVIKNSNSFWVKWIFWKRLFFIERIIIIRLFFITFFFLNF